MSTLRISTSPPFIIMVEILTFIIYLVAFIGRVAKENDCEKILQLFDEYAGFLARNSRKNTNQGNNLVRRTFYRELIARKDVKIFVAEVEGKLVAVADIFLHPLIRRGYLQCHVEDFFVTESMRGRGLGTALFNEIRKFCKLNGVPVIKLTSGFELEVAHSFYEKMGGTSTEKMFRFDL